MDADNNTFAADTLWRVDTSRLGQLVAAQMDAIEEQSPEGSELGHVLSIVQVRHANGDAAILLQSTCDWPYEILGLLQMAQIVCVK